MSSPAHSKGSIGRIAWPLVWAIAFLVLFEFALEVRAAGRGFSTHFFGQPEATTKRVDEAESQTYGPTKGFPFRSRIVEPEKELKAVRIWLASSSHAEDIRMPAADVFPAVLERELNQQGVRCQVLNASRAGMTLQQNSAELTSLAEVWKPDIVIAYQMSNDITSHFHTGDESSEGTKPVPQGLLKLTDSADRFVEQTTLYELLKSNVTARITQSKILRKDASASATQLYFQQLKRLEESATNAKAKFFVCTFGFSHHESELPDDYKLVLLKTLPDLQPAAWAHVVRDRNQVIRDQYSGQVLDVASAIYEKPELFRDPVHFSKRGHEIVGQAIAEQLLSRRSEVLSSAKAQPQ